MNEDRLGERFVWDLLENMYDKFPELEMDGDGPVDHAAWRKRWDEISSLMDSEISDIPLKGEDR